MHRKLLARPISIFVLLILGFVCEPHLVTGQQGQGSLSALQLTAQAYAATGRATPRTTTRAAARRTATRRQSARSTRVRRTAAVTRRVCTRTVVRGRRVTRCRNVAVNPPRTVPVPTVVAVPAVAMPQAPTAAPLPAPLPASSQSGVAAVAAVVGISPPISSAADYRWIDAASSLSDAIDNAPPDATFSYQGITSWIWTTERGETLIVEPAEDGLVRYFYAANAAAPYLVRDAYLSFAYDGPTLAQIYDDRGNAIATGPSSAQLRQAAALQDRGRRIYSAGWRRRYGCSWSSRARGESARRVSRARFPSSRHGASSGFSCSGSCRCFPGSFRGGTRTSITTSQRTVSRWYWLPATWRAGSGGGRFWVGWASWPSAR